MGAPAKFLFDHDFSAPDRARVSADTAQEIASAETRGYQSGYATAQREAAIASERQMIEAQSEVANGLRAAAAAMAQTQARLEADALTIAVAVARRLAGDLIAANPLSEIATLVGDCMRQMTATPHLAIRINDALYDGSKATLERLARETGFQGKLVILAEPDIARGDCRIEWADGGVTLDRTRVEAKIDDLIAQHRASLIDPNRNDTP